VEDIAGAAGQVTTAPAAGTDEAVLSRFGYTQELRRKLRFFSVFAVGFSIISITTGIFLNYGFGLTYWGPAMIWLWPIAVVGQVLVALVVAELSTRSRWPGTPTSGAPGW
jgi:amino acid transporter